MQARVDGDAQNLPVAVRTLALRGARLVGGRGILGLRLLGLFGVLGSHAATRRAGLTDQPVS